MHRHPALHVGQCKGVHTIASVGSTDQIEQRIILAYRKLLTIGRRPTDRRKVEARDSDFTEKWTAHVIVRLEIFSIQTNPPLPRFNSNFCLSQPSVACFTLGPWPFREPAGTSHIRNLRS